MEEKQDRASKKKKKYLKPELKSEKLNAYGAVCNGTVVGGRKAVAGPPTFCNSSRLNS
jgi:hypothetical protein